MQKIRNCQNSLLEKQGDNKQGSELLLQRHTEQKAQKQTHRNRHLIYNTGSTAEKWRKKQLEWDWDKKVSPRTKEKT